MSVAVGIECEGGVWLAADSVVLDGSQRDIVGGKLIGFDGFGVASVGYARAMQVLRYYVELPPPGNAALSQEWAATALVAELRDLADQHEPWPSGEDDKGWALLVATCGRLYVIDETYSALRSMRGYQAVGAGAEIALGSLHSTRSMDARSRAQLAVEAAAEHSVHVSLPVEMLWVPA